jgi:hypothetical protein
LGKLLAFHIEHQTPATQLHEDLDAAVEQVPTKAHAHVAVPLQAELDKLAHRRGPQPLAEILPLVLARLMGRVLQSKPEDAAS